MRPKIISRANGALSLACKSEITAHTIAMPSADVEPCSRDLCVEITWWNCCRFLSVCRIDYTWTLMCVIRLLPIRHFTVHGHPEVFLCKKRLGTHQKSIFCFCFLTLDYNEVMQIQFVHYFTHFLKFWFNNKKLVSLSNNKYISVRDYRPTRLT
jgi:hypothetical protein